MKVWEAGSHPADPSGAFDPRAPNGLGAGAGGGPVGHQTRADGQGALGERLPGQRATVAAGIEAVPRGMMTLTKPWGPPSAMARSGPLCR